MANVIIKKWEFVFKKEWKDTMHNTVSSFADFVYFEGYKESIDLTNPVRLGGLVYGREGFPDGSDVCTSNIVKIERIPISNNLTELIQNGNDGNRFVATTESGTRYEFVELGPDGMSPNQFLMMGTVIHGSVI